MNPLSYFYTIRSYVESYAALIGRRFLSLLWVVALCIVIWFYGYLVALGDFKPLGTTQSRLIAIGIILAIWLIYIVVTIYRGRKQDKELVDSIEREALANRQAEVGEIQTRLKEALALLRRVTKSASVIFTTCPGMSSSAHRAPARQRRSPIPACNFRLAMRSAKTP